MSYLAEARSESHAAEHTADGTTGTRENTTGKKKILDHHPDQLRKRARLQAPEAELFPVTVSESEAQLPEDGPEDPPAPQAEVRCPAPEAAAAEQDAEAEQDPREPTVQELLDAMWRTFSTQAPTSIASTGTRTAMKDSDPPAGVYVSESMVSTATRTALSFPAASQTDRMELAMLPAWPNRRTLQTQTADPESESYYHITLEMDCHVFPNCL